MSDESKLRIGVYICRCGGNISNSVNVNQLQDAVKQLPDVTLVETDDYLCSTIGQETIRQGILEDHVDRFVIAACTPRMHLETFRRTIASMGMNPFLLEIANIREQASWVHDEADLVTSKAIDLIRGAVNRAKYLDELEEIIVPVNQRVLVVGGGIAGIQAALDIADQGYSVILLDRNPYIGGHMAQLSKTFPTLDCSLCILAPKLVNVEQHPNIEVMTMAEVCMVSGSPGDYTVSIEKKPRYVTEDCTLCGDCEPPCPVVTPNTFESGLIANRAIYLPYAQSVPSRYVIDMTSCVRSDDVSCDKCFQVCAPRAIDFDMKPEIVDVNVGSIVVATGFDLQDPTSIGEYQYGTHPDIITNLQFERLLIDGLRQPSTGQVPKKVAFILCVGSRMLTMNTGRGVDHCCKIGCMAAIKQAILSLKEIPNLEPVIFYQDIRADGKGYEEFYAYARDHDVKFVRGRVAGVIPSKEGIVVNAEDTVLSMQIAETFDLVVLSPAILPSKGTEMLSKLLGIHLGSDGFFLERHYKLRPVDSAREGIFLSGCALSPKDVRETVLESMSTASKVLAFIGKGEYSASPKIATVSPQRCTRCELCIPKCPMEALSLVDSAIQVHPISCIGCGICVVECPHDAIDLKHCTEKQLLSQIRGISTPDGQPKILAFLDEDVAYASADYAGQLRQTYPANVRIISIPSTGRIGLKHLLHAFTYGVDGIILIEGEGRVFSDEQLRQRARKLRADLRARGINPLRLVTTTTTIPQYHKLLDVFELMNKRLSSLGQVKEETRSKLEPRLKPNPN
jgi:heterodisulfide reductase subunit A